MWVECRTLETSCGGRRRFLRSAVMRLPCSFWFLLLLAAGGLLLLHLQDLTEPLQQQSQGAQVIFSRVQPVRKEQCSHCSDNDRQSSYPTDDNFPSPAHPVQLTVFSWARRTSLLTPKDITAAHVTKSHRKLLLKSGPLVQPLNTDPPGQNRDSTERLTRVQQVRQRLMREVCAKYTSGTTKRSVTRMHVSRIFVEDTHKLLYCEVPKAGCSNWKRVLMVLQGLAPSTGEIQHDEVHYGNHLKRLDSFDHKGIVQRLKTYTKVLFLREPFERLVSAFRDKFESPNSYYHPVFGKPIISRYRSNATQQALRTGAGVTFKEFIQYLLDVHRPVGMDIHWEPVGQLCSPCLLDYDFIGKFETLEEEANFLLRSFGAPSNLTFPSFKDRNPNAERTSSEIMRRYFAQLNVTERQRAYDFYYMDYLMFNYSKPFNDLY
ncbi:carbohydrate sulfotransferase 8 [Triplophysa rosa]|uniref:carbohydrate sulfotransferase 8 n=1 Tax=Triplophysa rosa TaxID=992332 RepID=UPI002545C6A7|nr:carbohydrate sulfotransferase 8 [Triplophysa rosa]XP_057185646.1 carbohydrate sulfotransferase 8 [Triplophysa rosa]XP_057185647.1 carbohydrate sulfotransferase 8 [Triplophysa rosa]